MWINGGNTTGTINIGAFAANIFVISNGGGNCIIALAADGNINMTASALNLNTVGIVNTGDLFVNQDIEATGQIISTNGSGPGFRAAQLARTGTSTGVIGDICWDGNYIYVCTGVNVWKRATLSSF